VPGGRRSIVAALAVLAILGTACGGDEPSTPVLPSSGFPSSTGTSSGSTGPTVSGPGEATGSTGSAPSGGLTEGTLDLTITGDVELRTSLTRLISGVLTPAPGALAVVWSGAGFDATTVGIGGASFVGTQASSDVLVVTMTVQTATGFFTWVSTAGECQVALGMAETGHVAGTFACRDLTASTGEVVDASASFDATG
jgi:hypothetical protein